MAYSSIEIFKTDPMTRYLPDLVAELELIQLQNELKNMQKSKWTQDSILTRPDDPNEHLYSSIRGAKHLGSLQSCRDDGWDTTAKYLSREIPQLLSSEEINNIQNMLSVIFTSAPANLCNFIKWVAEVRKQDGTKSVSDEELGRLIIKVRLFLLLSPLFTSFRLFFL